MKKILIALFCTFLSTNLAVATDVTCAPGQYQSPEGIGCVTCPKGSYCANNAKKTCPENHPNSDEGAKAETECYKMCQGNLESGTNAYYNQTCQCVDNASLDTGTNQCICNTGYEPQGNTCVPVVYKITLDKNCTVCPVKKGEFYEKYSVGFANTNNDSEHFVSAKDFTVNLNILDTNTWFGYELTGYYSSKNDGILIVGPDGYLATNIDSTYFKKDEPIYAHWNGKIYNITYTGDFAPNNLQECTFGIPCNIQSPTQKPDGSIFNGWKCTSGCKNPIDVQAGEDFKDQEDTINKLTITLEAQWEQCPAGYYCTDGNKNPCPRGATSDKGSTNINKCYLARGTGNNVTQFCDDDGCFTVPEVNGMKNIPYYKR